MVSGKVGSALVLLVCVVGSQAFLGNLFNRQHPTATADGRAVSQECLQKANAGSCDFYSCFEERLSCGRTGYPRRQGGYYCEKMNRLKSSFTPAGQTFLTNAQTCMTQAMREVYQLDYISCHTLEHQAVANTTQCFLDNGFCDVVQDNLSQFYELYEFTDLVSHGAMKLWRAVTALLANCAQQGIDQAASSARERLTNAFNRVFNRD